MVDLARVEAFLADLFGGDVANDRPADRIHGWRKSLAASPVGIGPFEEAYARLLSLADRVPEGRHLIHIGLAGMAYQAYAGDWTNLESTARRTLELAWS